MNETERLQRRETIRAARIAHKTACAVHADACIAYADADAYAAACTVFRTACADYQTALNACAAANESPSCADATKMIA